MALNSGKILMRRGQEVNFDPNKMTPGEWAVSLDSKYVRMCFSPGVCVRMATYDAFEADMVQIQRILAECQTVEEAVQRIYEEIKDVAVDVERIETAAANALKSEQNALNSANSASQSANTAVNKASEASESANTASAKAEQATEGARIATEKANEAADSAENVRNMSDASQSYAVGGTGTREGEDTDNSKYYNQQASDNADRAEAAAERASAVADVGVATTEKAGLVKPDGETIRVEPDGTIHADRGTTSYTDLENKPKINDVVLEGEKTLEELGIASKEALEETDSKVNIIIEQAELRFKENASGEHIHLDDSADAKLVEFGMYGKTKQNTTSGKNLLPYPYKIETQTFNGITYTVNNDGTVKANGTATAFSYFQLSNQVTLKSNTDYIISANSKSGKVGFQMRTPDSSISKVSYKEQTALTTGVDNNYYAFVIVNVGDAVNETIYPMIRLASITDDTWEPYTGGIPSPNPEYPQDIEVAGESGSVEVKSENEDGTKSKTATIPTENGLAGIPVDSGGNYTDSNGQQWICDEVVKYADGSGEKIQRVGIIDSYSAETITGVYMSTTGELTEGAKILYQLAQPIRTSLTAEELAEIEKLSTFYSVTNILNDADCGMKVKYIADAKRYIDNRLALIEQAMLNSI